MNFRQRWFWHLFSLVMSPPHYHFAVCGNPGGIDYLSNLLRRVVLKQSVPGSVLGHIHLYEIVCIVTTAFATRETVMSVCILRLPALSHVLHSPSAPV